jgi:hypothetical protein
VLSGKALVLAPEPWVLSPAPQRRRRRRRRRRRSPWTSEIKETMNFFSLLTA